MIIIGDGGHAKVVRRVIYALHLPIDSNILNDDFAFVAIGKNSDRKREAARAARVGYMFPVLIHPSANVDETARIGEGTVIMAGAVVQADAWIGKHCILNSSCSVDHDCVLKDYAHIAPGAHLCGDVVVGEGALVGVGVGLAPGCRIPAWSLVKAQGIVVEPLSGN